MLGDLILHLTSRSNFVVDTLKVTNLLRVLMSEILATKIVTIIRQYCTFDKQAVKFQENLQLIMINVAWWK